MIASVDRDGVVRDAGKIAETRKKFVEKRAVLVADSSDGGFFMMRRAFTETKEPHMLRRARDGAEALAYVMGREKFSDRQHFPFPDLVIADSALPKVGGVEMLRYMRRELGLEIPVVIFAGTLVLNDMRTVTELGRAEYFVRPVSFSVLLELVMTIEQNWLEGSRGGGGNA